MSSDGSPDLSFVPGAIATAGGTPPVVYSLQVQADAKILVAGVFDSIGGVARRNLARLNSDGSLDTTFDPGTGTDAAVRSLLPQPDGSLIIGGDFNTVNGAVEVGVARLLPAPAILGSTD